MVETYKTAIIVIIVINKHMIQTATSNGASNRLSSSIGSSDDISYASRSVDGSSNDISSDEDDGLEPIDISLASPQISMQNLAEADSQSVGGLTTLLVSALRKAMEAVTADHSGRSTLAMQAYKDCIILLKQVLSTAPLATTDDDDDQSKDRQRVVELITVYTERMQILQATVLEMQKDALMPDWRLDELPLGPTNRWGRCELMRMEVAPKWVEHRVYWLFRQLRRSITEGGPLTANLYIPKQIWCQRNVKFTAIETKFDCIEMVVMWLQKVCNLDITDCPALCGELDEFIAVLDMLRNTLARKLRFIKAADKSPGLMGSITKQMERMRTSYSRDKVEDVSEYLKLLVKLFDNCQFLDDWLMHFSTLPYSPLISAVTERLGRISEFLHDTICAFIIDDLRLLLEKYLKGTRKTFLAY